ncbi:hypothetical protein XH99_20370 [Bradyrhizobium nanningense]|uniref:UmuC domain-containing protein n=1 Tax=Bradyrhizobium nanningense TaxID=1325118 RepID=A0A4Q0S2N4_9BRAD|nr:hypothetical protein XH99_20370 [Bradyrhizobium nanningense]RXH29534.1 hypothetical protein XH84_21180 [Bradyrhizobium nanningense]
MSAQGLGLSRDGWTANVYNLRMVRSDSEQGNSNAPHRKIIHIDMDAFYASVEQRDKSRRSRHVSAAEARSDLAKTRPKLTRMTNLEGGVERASAIVREGHRTEYFELEFAVRKGALLFTRLSHRLHLLHQHLLSTTGLREGEAGRTAG